MRHRRQKRRLTFAVTADTEVLLLQAATFPLFVFLEHVRQFRLGRIT